MRTTPLAVVILASALGVYLRAQESATDTRRLQGTWRVAEVHISGPTPRSIVDHNPGMVFITAKHLAFVVEAGDKPRPSERPKTFEELHAVIDPFVSFAGPYEIAGGVLTVRVAVHKNPALMGSGKFMKYSYKLEGDTLTLHGTETHLGPRPDPFTWKLTRLE